MARPQAAMARPVCPQGHSGSVRLHGARAVPGGAFEKTRWACVIGKRPGEQIHTWTANRRTPTHLHPDGATCPSCEHEARRGDGPTVVPRFSFPVADAARDLLLVGEGKSLRESSQKVRYAAGKFDIDSDGRRWASRQNALSADYLDQFGPLVVRSLTPSHWPRILVLDSLPLGIRVRDAHLYGYQQGREGAAVLVAAGRQRNQPRTRCWLATLAADETADSWYDFLTQLDPEPAPVWVVADGSKAIRNAVEAIWPNAIFYPCEEHLRKNALDAARDDGALGEPGVEEAIKRAFYGIETWEHLGLVANSFGPSLLLGWYLRTDPDARRMVEAKHRFAYPAGNGPAEAVALAIKTRIGKRTRVFRNAERLATVIALMGLDIAEQASHTAFSRIIREELERTEWDPEINWEGPHDYAGETSSLDELIMDGWERQAQFAPGAMTEAVSASVERKAAAINVLRLAAGVEPLTPTVKPGRAVASVSVKGKTLADYPELMAEWDAERNDPVEDLASMPAGRGIRAYWKCQTCGHQWRAWLTDRTSRLTRCRICHRPWADEKTSITAVCPEIVPEWDADENGKRTPDRTKATNEVPAWWRCADAASGHPLYPMSPKARINWVGRGKPGCPACRSKLTQRAQRAARRRGEA